MLTLPFIQKWHKYSTNLFIYRIKNIKKITTKNKNRCTEYLPAHHNQQLIREKLIICLSDKKTFDQIIENYLIVLWARRIRWYLVSSSWLAIPCLSRAIRKGAERKNECFDQSVWAQIKLIFFYLQVHNALDLHSFFLCGSMYLRKKEKKGRWGIFRIPFWEIDLLKAV